MACAPPMVNILLTPAMWAAAMFVPYGFGDIYLNKILMANIDKFGKPVGMDVSGVSIYQAMAIPALGMVAGLAIAVFYSYRKPRDYQDLPVEGAAEQIEVKPLNIIIGLTAVIAAFLVQKYSGSLILAGLTGFAIFMVTHVIHWQQADTVFNNGIRLMSMIAFIIITSNGFAAIMNATGGIEPLVRDSVAFFGDNRSLVVLVMLVVGLLVTMGIGSSFSTLPIIAAIYSDTLKALHKEQRRRRCTAARRGDIARYFRWMAICTHLRAHGLLAAGDHRHHRHCGRSRRCGRTRLRHHPRFDDGIQCRRPA